MSKRRSSNSSDGLQRKQQINSDTDIRRLVNQKKEEKKQKPGN